MSDVARWRRTNPLALAVLVLLFEGPNHPYELARTAKLRHQDEAMRLNFGSLYSVVNSLERHGLIDVVEVVRDGRRPERTIYGITESGVAEATEWLSDLLSLPVKEHLQFEAALALLGALGARRRRCAARATGRGAAHRGRHRSGDVGGHGT